MEAGRHDGEVIPLRAASLLLFALLLSPAGCASARPEASPAPPPTSGQPCVPIGRWVEPGSGARLTTAEFVPGVAQKRVVLLGEAHDNLEHHAWQLQTLAALSAARDEIVVAFEMLPRRVQQPLDDWIAGELDEQAFLEGVDWGRSWSLPAELYLPLFRFARLNRFPAVALNVDRRLIERVGDVGWAVVPVDEREGLTDPAPASDAYRAWLADVYGDHAPKDSAPLDPTALDRFTDAQLVWDRAFAEGIAAALERHPHALVVGIIGGGHVQHRWGVPHQLAALGIDDVAVLLPWDDGADCSKLTADLADAVFGVEDTGASVANPPRLGVLLTTAERGVKVAHVAPASIAAAAGIADGDVILEAAGTRVAAPADLQEIVTRQAPGTWLPLRIARGDAEVEVVARFPVP
jgi:uncharacterized iron-regulated protein